MNGPSCCAASATGTTPFPRSWTPSTRPRCRATTSTPAAAPPPAFHRGRVALLGDAVHPMTPNLGQGGRQAIEDAVVPAHEVDHEAASQDGFGAALAA
ncbi:FAD-dependent monooxygenase [Streptomyces sp. NPDC017993]|uniref:FAD-dependent monooxygenase n=1 Tax=Streptomyces sp. NPDC017993 TaxID=3365027 RepID=UPI0037A49A86